MRVIPYRPSPTKEMNLDPPNELFPSPQSPEVVSPLSPEIVEQQMLDGTQPIDKTALSTIPSLRPFSFSVQSTQPDESSRYMFTPSFGLTLEDLDVIKTHLVANGNFGEEQEESLKWLKNNITILPCLFPQSGNNLENLVGKEYVYVKDALLALDLLSQYGVITAEEFLSSEDAQLLVRSHHHDRLTFHSLANVVRNILKERPESKTILYLS
ncbi:hypothetical protein RB195_013473 [Necator americanus]|uniref:Uncharacterized protein n=1 Tax=Necator americanus TaxID=51031 RepID=A0ABR1DVM3_NECAM